MAQTINWKNTIDKSLYLLADMLDDKGSVGSIIITGVNKSPVQLYGLDGTWECIKKEFEPKWTTVASNANLIKFNTTYSKNSASGIYRAGDGLTIRLYWTNVKKIDDGVESLGWVTPIGTVNWTLAGVTNIPYDVYTPGQCDSLNAIPHVTLNGSTGALNINDWTTQATSYPTSTGQGCGATLYIPHLPPEKMLDDFCQTWYWKRTA